MAIRDISDLIEGNEEEVEQEVLITPDRYLSTGSTMVNLALTDNPYAGYLKGHYYRVAGQSKAAKTLMAMYLNAEASINEHFNNYRLIYDPTEQGNLMPVEKMFGKKAATRLESPNIVKGVPTPSSTIESFYFNMDRACERAGYSTRHQRRIEPSTEHRPFIYTLDSHEGLTSEAELKKNDQNRKIFDKASGADESSSKEDKEGELKGSYGDGKAKANSTNIRRLMHPLEVTGSIFLMISQLRDDPTARFKTQVTAGGRALHYYASGDIWTKIVGKIWSKPINGVERHIGNKVEFDIIKNRITGRNNTVTCDVYPETGFDDMGSCIEYLVKEQRWGMKNGYIDAPDLKMKFYKDKLISKIESLNLENKVRDVCGEVWLDVKAKSIVQRKNRYV